MDDETWYLYNRPRPATAWCGGCSICAALRRAPSRPCGCPLTNVDRCSAAGTEPFVLEATVPRRGAGPATPACLDSLGKRLAHALYWGYGVAPLPRLKPQHVLSEAVAVAERRRRTARGREGGGELTAQQALVIVVSHLQHLTDQGDLSPQTLNKMAAGMGSLVSYLTVASASGTITAVTAGEVRSWLHTAFGGRRSKAASPSLNTKHARLTAARMFFRVLRNLGVFAGDPTLDLSLPPRGKGTSRPLQDDELLLLQCAVTDAGVSDSPRLAACLALAEAGVVTGELAGVRICDVDLARGRVWLRGTRQRQARWVYLSVWGRRHLTTWINQQRQAGASLNDSAVYGGDGSPESRQAAACWAMSEILRRAGLRGEGDLKPNSIAARYGLRVYLHTGDIRLAQSGLGMFSLDATLRTLGLPEAASAAEVTDEQAETLAACVLASRENASAGDTEDAAPSAAESPARVRRGGRPRQRRAQNVRVQQVGP